VSSFAIQYKIENHGWATICVQNGKQKFESSVSYLHDSLNDLAQMAIDLKNGATKAQSLFMDEPGELLIVVTIKNGEALCEARLYRDWASWGIVQDTDFKVVLSGTNTIDAIVTQISDVLSQIHDDIGVEEYRKRWIEHDFPAEKYKLLING